MLDQSLHGAAGDLGAADGPAVGRRHARHAKEVIVLRGIRRGEDGPRDAVPVLEQGIIGAAGAVIADGPAVGRRCARHTTEVVDLRSANVGRADNGPRGPVPTLDQRLMNVVLVAVVADSPAIGCGHARYAIEDIGRPAVLVG